MNLILFERREAMLPLPRTDRRAIHILEVLRRKSGDTFDAGLIDGPLGKGTLAAIESETLGISFKWEAEPPALNPLTLIIGLPRPQTARKILQEATSLGAARIHFVATNRGEPNYASSSLWKSGEWRRHVIAGAEQAFCTRLPEVSYGKSLNETIETLPANTRRIALDNYESDLSLGEAKFNGGPATLAIGAERGWSPAEREFLRHADFLFVHLGRRILRTETACIAALAIINSQSHWA